MKIAIMFDSSCGYTKQEILAKGGFFIPVGVNCDGKDYKPGIDFTTEGFRDILKDSKVCKSSSVSLGDVKEEIERAFSLGYDHLIYFPLSKGVSSTYENVLNFVKNSDEVKKYSDRISVYDSDVFTYWLQPIVDHIFSLSKTHSVEEILNIVGSKKQTRKCCFVPGNLETLKRSGRISKFQYFAASLFGIIPILLSWDGRIDKGVEKTRKLEKNLDRLTSIPIEWKNEFPNEKIKFVIVSYSTNAKKEDIKQRLIKKGVLETDIMFVAMSPEVTLHAGTEYYGLAIMGEIK